MESNHCIPQVYHLHFYVKPNSCNETVLLGEKFDYYLLRFQLMTENSSHLLAVICFGPVDSNEIDLIHFNKDL